jgi:hypothetical protein
MTRLYMDFLRMEGEANYLSLLPSKRRVELASWWYRGVSTSARKRVMSELLGSNTQPTIHYRSAEPEVELDAALEQRVSGVLAHSYDLKQDAIGAQLHELEGMRGAPATSMPEISFLEIDTGNDNARYFSVLRDSAHSNVAELFDEKDRRLTDEDSLRVVPGFLGAYPNAIFHLRASEVPQFVSSLAAVKRPSDYTALRARFGVLRYSQQFWPASDRLHAAYRDIEPLTSGSFDYNRLQAP